MAGAALFPLSNGRSIPSIGLGTWKSKPVDAYESVKFALKAGYRHIDTAFVSPMLSSADVSVWKSLLRRPQNYGNETDIGRAIKDSGIPRGDIFLTTKL